MKRFLIFYSLVSILIGIFIYVMTLIEVTATRTNDVYYQLAEDAVLERNIEEFVKFSTDGFVYLDTFEDDQYHIDVIQVKVLLNDVLYQQLGIFVIPKTEIQYATELRDDMDLTRAIVSDDDLVLYDSRLIEENTYAMSYGIHVLGFYFYAFEYTEAHDIDIILTDYQGETIYTQTLNLPLEFDTSIFIEGYSDDELEALIGANVIFEKEIIERLTYFITADILIGAIIFFIIKFRRLHS